jgi:3-oxoacyl-[acyl-carrier-protein] synthase III
MWNHMCEQAYLAGVGTQLPGEPIDNTTLAEVLGVSAEWIDLFIGTKTRHFSRDLGTGEVRWTLGELCARAADTALRDSGLDRGDIEFIVMGTATPDELMPATVNQVADALGLSHLPTYQLQSGCAGAIQALDIGQTLIRRGHRAGLVIGGDVCSKHLDLSRDFRGAAPSELVNFVLFGDGAGATVLSAEPRGHGIAVRRVLNQFTGLGREPGQRIQWFGMADRHTDSQAVDEDYKAIEESVPPMAVEILWELLDDLQWNADDLAYLLPPQLSGRMTRLIWNELDVPRATEVSVVVETGNNGNALPFQQLAAVVPRMAPGDRAIAVAVESSKWIKAGFALEKAA